MKPARLMQHALALGRHATWEPLADGRASRRELHVSEATSGLLDAVVLRLDGTIDAPLYPHLPPGVFEFFYVVSGHCEVTALDGSRWSFGAADAAWQCPLLDAPRLIAASGTEVLSIRANPFHDGRDPVWKPCEQGRPLVSRDHEGAFGAGKGGPRDFFRYRDFGVAQASQRQIDVQVLAARMPREGGTGWHSHTMDQFFMVLQGSATISTDFDPDLQMVPGDGMCVPAGMRHNVPAFSADYALIQVQFPADYETRQEGRPA